MIFSYHQVLCEKKMELQISYVGRNHNGHLVQLTFQCLKAFYDIPTGGHSDLQSWKCSKGIWKEWEQRTKTECQLFYLYCPQYVTDLEIYINLHGPLELVGPSCT